LVGHAPRRTASVAETRPWHARGEGSATGESPVAQAALEPSTPGTGGVPSRRRSGAGPGVCRRVLRLACGASRGVELRSAERAGRGTSAMFASACSSSVRAAQPLRFCSMRWHRRGRAGVTCSGPTRAIMRARHSAAPTCACLPCAWQIGCRTHAGTATAGCRPSRDCRRPLACC
jgi:hypothetical protein